MRISKLLFLAAVLTIAGPLAAPDAGSQSNGAQTWTIANREALLNLFRSLPLRRDSTNRFAGKPDAEVLGEKLFFDPGLSSNGQVSCASCHEPSRQWTDGKQTSHGVGEAKRNAPTLIRATDRRWLGWTGESTSPWSQATKPLENLSEMGGSRFHVYRYVASQQTLRSKFETLTGKQFRAECIIKPETSNCVAEVTSIFADVAKMIGAFEATIPSPPTRFDHFLAALAAGETSGADFLTPNELAGLQLFVGRGLCSSCHHGSDLTDGEFHNILIPERAGSGIYDKGRYGVLETALSQEFSTASQFSDCRTCEINDRITRRRENSTMFGAFRTPTLRGVMCTAPYMHNGILETMDDVLDHYSEFRTGVAPAHADDPFVQPRQFSIHDRLALTAFLQILTPAGLEEVCNGRAWH